MGDFNFFLNKIKITTLLGREGKMITSCVVRFFPKDGSFSEAEDVGSEILEMTTKEEGGFV